MYPGTYAAEAPDRAAAVMADTGETLSYGDLERRSVQLAHVLHEAGLRPGDVVALLTENNLRAFEVYWAAMRSGLYITAVNWHLKPDEIAYIVNDSGATALIVSAEQAQTAELRAAQAERERDAAARIAVAEERGFAHLETVDGVADEYLEAAKKALDPDTHAGFEGHVRLMYKQQVRISIEPRWARFYDFGAGRLPAFLTELAASA